MTIAQIELLYKQHLAMQPRGDDARPLNRPRSPRASSVAAMWANVPIDPPGATN